MELYRNFIGIDIGKYEFVVSVYGEKQVKSYDNTEKGIEQFIKERKLLLKSALNVLETTGGYESALLDRLVEKGYKVHRADTRKVKHFIHSYGHGAKTDALDAKALSLYGYERRERLSLYEGPSKARRELMELVLRRDDIQGMLVAEKNRLKAPKVKVIKASCEKTIAFLSEEIKILTERINGLIASDEMLSGQKTELMSIPGVGPITANKLLVLLPELGNISRRAIASLVGLAPRSKESGQYRGYRSTGHGRRGIKPALFLAAMAARNSKSALKIFYEQLIERGKVKMVALTALMRKLLVIANAKIRDFNKTRSLRLAVESQEALSTLETESVSVLV